MKLSQVLKEAESISADSLDELKQLIHTECSQYLREKPVGKNLYRGIYFKGVSPRARPAYSVNHTLANRSPVDTDPGDHWVIDNWFQSQFGIAFRSNHIVFCTGNMHQASAYGSEYAVFPCNGYKYIWSPLIRDLTSMLPNQLPHIPLEDRAEIIESILERGQYRMSGLSRAIDNGTEIMVHCDKYIIVDPNQVDIAVLLE